MNWQPVLNRQGAYWWEAQTPMGPVYATWEDDHFPLGWYAYWHPYDVDKETPISRHKTQEEAMDAAAKWIRAHARKTGKRLVKFGGGK